MRKYIVLVSLVAILLSSIELKPIHALEPSIYPDGFLEFTSGDVETIESQLLDTYTKIDGNQMTILKDLFSTEVETYKKHTASSDRVSYYTVITIESIGVVNRTKEDILEVNVNDALGPVSPAKGLLYERDNLDDEWGSPKEIYPLIKMDGATVFGSEINGSNDYFKLVVYFPSIEGSSSELPRYNVSYTNQITSTQIIRRILIGSSVFVLTILIVVAVIRNQKKNQKK